MPPTPLAILADVSLPMPLQAVSAWRGGSRQAVEQGRFERQPLSPRRLRENEESYVDRRVRRTLC